MSPDPPPEDLPHIGWREWVALPDLGVPHIKAKIDTGAKTSALHAFDIEILLRGRRRLVRFKVHPFQRDASTTVTAEAELADEREIRSSTGHVTRRPVIETVVEILGALTPIELTLVGRDEMGFRMLVGREALRKRFLVDPGRSYVGGRPERKRKRKKGAWRDRRP
jgi:hypothetical protein